MNYNASQTRLYPEYTKVSIFFLSNGFHGVFAYIGQQDQHQRKYQDEYESNIRGYKLTDKQSDIDFGSSTMEKKFDSKLEGRRGWFRIFHVKTTKKFTCTLRLGKGNSFLSLQYLEAKEIMQIS
jgi:cell division protein FtsI/penicillin-binding protein 2